MASRWALLLLLGGCENDVALHLLREEPPPPEPCLDGEPCSGLERALSFHGPYDRVEVQSSPLLDVPQDFAVEAWVLVRSYEGGHGVLNRWVKGVADLQLTFGAPEPLPTLELPSDEPVPSHVLASWAFVRPELWLTALAPSLPSTGAWHHLASCYGSGSFRLYVDGKLVASVVGTEPIPNPQSTLFVGATARYEGDFDEALGTRYWPPIDGFIADVRLSNTERYSSDFEPETRLSVDASTLALWHLDEGEGAAAVDSGKSQLAGAIHGARWELALRR